MKKNKIPQTCYQGNYQISKYIYDRFGARKFRFAPDYFDDPCCNWIIEYKEEITEELENFICETEAAYPQDIEWIANYNFYQWRPKKCLQSALSPLAGSLI